MPRKNRGITKYKDPGIDGGYLKSKFSSFLAAGPLSVSEHILREETFFRLNPMENARERRVWGRSQGGQRGMT